MARPTLRWSVAAGSTLITATRSRWYAGLGDRYTSTTPRHARKQSTVTLAAGQINHVENGSHRTILVITIVRYSPDSVAPSYTITIVSTYRFSCITTSMVSLTPRHRPLSPPAHRTVSATLLPLSSACSSFRPPTLLPAGTTPATSNPAPPYHGSPVIPARLTPCGAHDAHKTRGLFSDKLTIERPSSFCVLETPRALASRAPVTDKTDSVEGKCEGAPIDPRNVQAPVCMTGGRRWPHSLVRAPSSSVHS